MAVPFQIDSDHIVHDDLQYAQRRKEVVESLVADHERRFGRGARARLEARIAPFLEARQVLEGCYRSSEGIASRPVHGHKEADERAVAVEAEALTRWADTRGLRMEHRAFQDPWEEWERQVMEISPEFAEDVTGGGEHQVFLCCDGRWFKRNYGNMHARIGDLLDRYVLHNLLFPEAPYTLEGVIRHEPGEYWLGGRDLQLVVSQPDIAKPPGAPPASSADIQDFMLNRGFIEIKQRLHHSFYCAELGILVDDLHPFNIYPADDGELATIDPYITYPIPHHVSGLRLESTA